ncbi:MAG: hypothetical protein M3Y72_10450 [Acidobacteriota bacterium]|nr:hypothetical protein [Acidobacteriota bacterium]
MVLQTGKRTPNAKVAGWTPARATIIASCQWRVSARSSVRNVVDTTIAQLWLGRQGEMVG